MKVVDILMTRDDLPRNEAEILIAETAEENDEAIFNGADISEIKDIIRCNLGLEPDYLDDFL